jgi:leucyl-tRNA synthetase
VIHATIKKVSSDIEALSFNTAISQMMIFVNAFTNAPAKSLSAMRTLLVLLNPFAPHLTSELWEKIAERFDDSLGEISAQPWPEHDEAMLAESEVDIVLQVNGKLRDKVRVPIDAPDEQIEQIALASPKVQALIAGKEVRKVIVIRNKLVNIVAS